jgi:predicted amidohydrolase
MCQVYTEQWAVEDNLRRTLESLREAKRQGADLAITPSACCTPTATPNPERCNSALMKSPSL